MDYMEDLHELYLILMGAAADANDKLHETGGKVSSTDAQYIDWIVHSLKSIKAVISMEEDNDRSYRRSSYYRKMRRSRYGAEDAE